MRLNACASIWAAGPTKPQAKGQIPLGLAAQVRAPVRDFKDFPAVDKPNRVVIDARE